MDVKLMMMMMMMRSLTSPPYNNELRNILTSDRHVDVSKDGPVFIRRIALNNLSVRQRNVFKRYRIPIHSSSCINGQISKTKIICITLGCLYSFVVLTTRGQLRCGIG